jgi:diaminohydroxyphosphoribosylaminopyrimidine deaminase/5-amino-6-(5-phosphoribosylamino)uracil reductase
MKKAMELAQKGLGTVSPNPLVGCVIVKDGKIIAEGYHQKFGEAHAEVNAIHNLPSDIDPKDCTLYVNLEPCCHHGKTPPCCDLIIKKGFKHVVICNGDPNPLVAGIGIEKLKQAGVEVTQGICGNEGRYLNRRFFTFHEKKRPYIILKWAQTADGFISKWPLPVNRSENKISGEEAQILAHQLRASEDAILVGKNTVFNDDPFLTTRLVEGKNPIRVIITGDEIPHTYNIFNADANIIVFNPFKTGLEDHVHFIKLEHGPIIRQVIKRLYQLDISSVLVEGGLYTLNSFIAENLWDEKHIFVSPELQFLQGVKAPEIMLNSDFQYIGKDKYFHILNSQSSK